MNLQWEVQLKPLYLELHQILGIKVEFLVEVQVAVLPQLPGLCAAAIGSDTGGSIRQPASFCGVVGLKPTYGRVSRWGLIAFASSLDQIGPITNTVSDAAEILYSISGKDPLDSTCLDKPVPNYLSDLNKSIKNLKIGIIRECLEHPGLNPEVKESVLSAVQRFKNLGAEIIEVECPRFNDGIATLLCNCSI